MRTSTWMRCLDGMGFAGYLTTLRLPPPGTTCHPPAE
ncbi:hypothetical protein HNP84_000048 [Thermocatellispora tengchongensis]|uniref:Uncharacterized protein n=1 Tax=Thermocatellispora tengchongensis TaxID=1073253 RepID=A0A840NZ00_9ACTN|nr:hypothetical protein [Thermocatellispora tengchongensis]